MQVAFPKFSDLADPRDCCYFCCFPKDMLCLARGRDLRSGNPFKLGNTQEPRVLPACEVAALPQSTRNCVLVVCSNFRQ